MEAPSSSSSRLFRSLLAVLAVLLVCVQVVLRQPLPTTALSPSTVASAFEAKPHNASTNVISAKEHQALKEQVQRLEAELNQHANSDKKRERERERVLIEPNPRQQQKDGDKNGTHPKSCAAVMQRMHDWNDCWRRHMMMQQDSNNSINPGSDLLLDKEISCPVLHLDTGVTTTAEVIGAPLYQYAYYAGQGFGRVVEHTTEACIMAFLLKRPCLINLSPRDPFHTWRSFIRQNTYRWDPAILHSIPNYARQLEDLAQKLPIIGDGEWGSALNVSDYTAKNEGDKSGPLVFPMNKKFNKGNWETFLQYYSADNSKRGNQVLFSPNWADAWFTRFSVGDILRDQYDCDVRQLQTMVQGALYGPTDLAWQLHQKRYNKAVSTVWKKDQKLVAGNTVRSSGQPAHRTRPHLSDVQNTVDNGVMPSYGSLHIRTQMLNMGRVDNPVPPDQITAMVRSCLKRAFQLSHSDDFPQNWWFLADNATIAAMVTDDIRNQQQPTATNKSLPLIKIFNAYDMDLAVEKAKTSKNILSSKHSMAKASTGLYGHANMAGSIEDWMALQESKLSIVTQDTAYGKTGARGNGKVSSEYCGNGKPGQTRQPFLMFMEPPGNENKAKIVL